MKEKIMVELIEWIVGVGLGGAVAVLSVVLPPGLRRWP